MSTPSASKTYQRQQQTDRKTKEETQVWHLSELGAVPMEVLPRASRVEALDFDADGRVDLVLDGGLWRRGPDEASSWLTSATHPFRQPKLRRPVFLNGILHPTSQYSALYVCPFFALMHTEHSIDWLKQAGPYPRSLH